MNFNNLFLIDENDNTKFSLSKILIIFYVFIVSNFSDNLLSKQLKQSISENRIFQHIVSLIGFFLLITTFSSTISTNKALLYSIFGYIWFILTTKLDLQFNLIIVISLLGIYAYENNLKAKEKELVEDENLTSDEKKKIIDNYNYQKSILILIPIATTFIGTFLYCDKKQVQYGGGFDYYKFFIE